MYAGQSMNVRSVSISSPCSPCAAAGQSAGSSHPGSGNPYPGCKRLLQARAPNGAPDTTRERVLTWVPYFCVNGAGLATEEHCGAMAGRGVWVPAFAGEQAALSSYSSAGGTPLPPRRLARAAGQILISDCRLQRRLRDARDGVWRKAAASLMPCRGRHLLGPACRSHRRAGNRSSSPQGRGTGR
jgi:hypothetical protein